ncbi:hypothetical protein C8R45DRAFT_923924 [Mycena sanguinolenta]|nr:hypothetical protein C8R45DRAFT_923924 [Mycena sanguinolenta]
MDWLKTAAKADPATENLRKNLQPGFTTRHVNLRTVSKMSLPQPFFQAEFGEKITDVFRGLCQKIEKQYQLSQESSESSVTTELHPTEEWSLLAQHVLKVVGTAALAHAASGAFRTSAPHTENITFVPGVTRCWESGMSIAGEGEGKTEVQKGVEPWFLDEFPHLWDWKPPMGMPSIVGRHSATASGGTVWSVTVNISVLSEMMSSGQFVWEYL